MNTGGVRRTPSQRVWPYNKRKLAKNNVSTVQLLLDAARRRFPTGPFSVCVTQTTLADRRRSRLCLSGASDTPHLTGD